MASRRPDSRTLRFAVLMACLLALAAALASPGAATAASAAGAGAGAEPSCAEGPRREGETIVGTPCADTIIVPPGVDRVEGGAGNDTIIADQVRTLTDCPAGCHLELGSTIFEGGPGNDIVFGERGNDILRGNGGNDQLYGGIGDDVLEGGPGDDLLSGGFGADHIDGGPGSDFVRGDGTQDVITDSGGNQPGEVDTLSYATGVTPGFGNAPAFPEMPPYPEFSKHANFPSGREERGVYLNLTAPSAEAGNNGGAPEGGGVDEVDGPEFERIIGSPFDDYIVGGSATEEILGGGGADVLIAGNAETRLSGGADGDDCVGGVPDSSCEETGAEGAVRPRNRSLVSVGEMAPGSPFAELYLVGGEGDDQVTVASEGAAPSETVRFTLSGGPAFDEEESARSGCEVESPSEAVCHLNAPLDSVLVAGMNGDDVLSAPALPATTSLILLGGSGNDELFGGSQSDDTLVDGPGEDVLHGGAGDDALLNDKERGELFGEAGNDLFLVNTICDGTLIEGGSGRDNASWAKLGQGVEARLDQGLAGLPGADGEPECPGGALDTLSEVEDLEGSSFADVLYGDGGENQLLGHLGADSFFAEGGDDTVLANAGDDDAAIDCGEGTDVALIDRHPQYDDPVPVECETVREAEPNNYRTATEPTPKPPPASAPVAKAASQPVDRTPPRTKLGAHPSGLLTTTGRHRRVIFRFSASQAGSRFRCKLDARPYRSCTSPYAYTAALGRHAVRVDAIDPAGNADPTPALFRFRVRRVQR